MVVEVQVKTGPEWDVVVAKLKGADRVIRKELNAGIREATKPVVQDLKSTVLGLSSKGYSSGGRAQRKAFTASRSKRGIARGSGSLRAHVAAAIQTKITYGGFRSGVRIRVDPRRMPEDQRKLPKAMNKGRWGHPVLGHRNEWVTQTVSPPGWFDRTVKSHQAQVRRDIEAAAGRALAELDGVT